MENIRIRRGEIYLTHFGEDLIGSEQRGIVYSVILQNDIGNSKSPTTLVAPIRGNTKNSKLPTNVLLEKKEYAFLKNDSVIMTGQVRCICKTRIIKEKRIGILSGKTMKEIEKALAISFGMSYGNSMSASTVSIEEGSLSKSSEIEREQPIYRSINHLLISIEDAFKQGNVEKVERELHYLGKYKTYYEREMTNSQYIEILLISALNQQDSIFLRYFPNIGTNVNKEGRYYSLLKEERALSEGKIIHEPLRKYINQNFYKFSKVSPAIKSIVEEKLREASIPYFESLRTECTSNICPRHRIRLTPIRCAIKLLNQSGYILATANYCKDCNQIFMEKADYNYFQKEISPNKVVITND